MPRYFGGEASELQELIVDGQGVMAEEFICLYRYRDECEPEENKIRYPNKEDRRYRSAMTLETISEARRCGVNVNTKYFDDCIEWNEEHQKYILQAHVFDHEEDYYAQIE